MKRVPLTGGIDVRTWLLAAITLLAAFPAQAAFHLWDIVEVFSNEDGSVQFVEFATTASTEIFLTGHVLRTRAAGDPLAEFTIPSDLAGSTANRRLLFATPGFEAVAGIPADFTIPAGFIEVGVADEVAFETVSLFPLTGLPTDGVDSLQVGGAVATNSPTNFAGETGLVVPEPDPASLAMTAFAGLIALRRGGSPGRR